MAEYQDEMFSSVIGIIEREDSDLPTLATAAKGNDVLRLAAPRAAASASLR